MMKTFTEVILGWNLLRLVVLHIRYSAVVMLVYLVILSSLDLGVSNVYAGLNCTITHISAVRDQYVLMVRSNLNNFMFHAWSASWNNWKVYCIFMRPNEAVLVTIRLSAVNVFFFWLDLLRCSRMNDSIERTKQTFYFWLSQSKEKHYLSLYALWKNYFFFHF